MTRNEAFIEYLQKLSTNRKALAALSQGISRGREYYAYPYLAKFCDLTKDRELFVYKTIAALYVLHPLCTDVGNIGSAFRNLIKVGDNPQAYEARMMRLLSAASAQEACQVLSKYFGLFRSKGLSFPYKSALNDLLFWGDRSKRSIAQSYWTTTEYKDA